MTDVTAMEAIMDKIAQVLPHLTHRAANLMTTG
jgi:hypothetical protein